MKSEIIHCLISMQNSADACRRSNFSCRKNSICLDKETITKNCQICEYSKAQSIFH